MEKGLLDLAQIYDFKNDYTGLDNDRVEEKIRLYGYNSDTKLDEKNKGYSPSKAFFNLRFVVMFAAAALSIWYGITMTDSMQPIVTGAVLLLLAGVSAATEIIKNTQSDKYFFEMKSR